MTSDLWVFAYGSLMWNPGFEVIEAVPARLTGYHRAYCLFSIHYRGTSRRPGLVLGLDRGGVCEGLAFRVPAESADQVRHYLRTRELITGVYREASLPVTLLRPAKDEVWAMTFIAERAHPSYVGKLPLPIEVHMMRKARGKAGFNLDYVLNTAAHLAELGIRERRIERLMTLLGPLLRRPGTAAERAGRSRALACASRGLSVKGISGRLRRCDRIRFHHRRVRPSLRPPE